MIATRAGKPCPQAHDSPRYASNGLCVECSRIHSARFRQLHPARKREGNKKWAAENPMKVLASSRKWHAANRERERISNRAWHRANPDRAKASAAKRRAAVAGAVTGDRRQYLAVVRRLRRAAMIPCHWCKGATNPHARHLDHVIPLSKGGSDVAANLCVSCPDCNRRKWARMPEDFCGQAELRFA